METFEAPTQDSSKNVEDENKNQKWGSAQDEDKGSEENSHGEDDTSAHSGSEKRDKHGNVSLHGYLMR